MDLFTLCGTIKIDYDNALAAIDEVKTEAEGLATYLNNGSYSGNGSTNNGNANTTFWGRMFTNIGKTATKSLTALDVAAGNLLASTVSKVTNAGKSFMQTGYEFNANMELWRKQLQNILKLDDSGANDFLNRLHQFAIDTPYAMEEVMSNAIQLLGNRKIRENTDIVELLTMIGNMSKGDNAAFSSLARGTVQVFAKGKVQAEEVNQQFAERGVDVYQMLADYFNFTGRDGMTDWDSASVMGLAAKPDTMATAQEFYEAMKYANFNEEGEYYGRMDAMMNTAVGQAQRMNDAYEMAAGSFAKVFFEVFNADTINALNDSLDKLYTWASTNPEGLKVLAESFNTFATDGVDVLTSALTKLVDYYGEHHQEISMIMSALGTILMFGGHPALGTGLIAMGQIGMGVYAEDKLAEDLGETADTGKFTVGSAVLRDDVEEKLANGANYDDLTDDEKKAYDLAEAAMTSLGFIDALINNVGIMDEKMPKDRSLSNEELDELYARYLELNYGVQLSPQTPDWMRDQIHAQYPNPWADMYKNEQTEPVENGRKSYTDNIIKDALNGIDEVVPGINPSANPAMLVSMLQQTLSTLKADVAEASREGVAAGLSGVTITGTVNTGNVQLDGVVVGKQLAPHVNFQLGWLGKLSGRG